MLITVEVIRDGAYNLLSEMERLDLIKINLPLQNNIISDGKLSNKFAGKLHLSDSAYSLYQKNLQESRSEWQRDIC